MDELKDSSIDDHENVDDGTLQRVLCEICLNILSNAREINRINLIMEGGHDSIRKDMEMKRLVSKTKAVKGQAIMTGREKDVLVQLLGGRTNREISHELHIDEKTVKNHLWKIYKKMEVSNRTQLLHKMFYE